MPRKRKLAPRNTPEAAEARWRRLSSYDPALAVAICERIAEGETLSKVCAGEGMPDRKTFRRWMVREPELRKAYEAARELQSHSLFDEALDLVRKLKDETLENAKVTALRVALEQLRWSAGKLNPAQYGEKSSPNGAMTVIVNTTLNLGASDRQLGPAPGENLYTLKAVVAPAIEASVSSDEPIQAEESPSRLALADDRRPMAPGSGDAG